MPKIFISHSWEDKSVARRLAESLKRDGADVWIDYAKIAGGDSLPKRIGEALKWCDTLLLVWSKSAEKSYYVDLEWETALDMRKRIILCPLDDTERPVMLRRLLYLSFKKFESGYKELASALGLLIKKERVVEAPAKKSSTGGPSHSVLRRTGKWLFFIAFIAALIVNGGYFVATQLFHSTRQSRREAASEGLLSESQPLSAEAAKQMLQEKHLFDSFRNPNGEGVENEFELQVINNDSVIIDAATGLVWQRSGSRNSMTLDGAVLFIDELNRSKFAGYGDWRLPKLEEAMSLMERAKKNGYLYIDPIFDKTQRWIWTADKIKSASRAWVVNFIYGYCNNSSIANGSYYVRAVRS